MKYKADERQANHICDELGLGDQSKGVGKPFRPRGRQAG